MIWRLSPKVPIHLRRALLCAWTHPLIAAELAPGLLASRGATSHIILRAPSSLPLPCPQRIVLQANVVNFQMKKQLVLEERTTKIFRLSFGLTVEKKLTFRVGGDEEEAGSRCMEVTENVFCYLVPLPTQ